jgi:carbon monoxide dehydrogenase subunit G
VASTKFEETVDVPPERVWETLTDAAKMKLWAGVRSLTIEHAGAEAEMGTGAIRAISTWLGTYREEVTSYDPCRRVDYRVVSGLPVRDYEGSIELVPGPSGTCIVYSVSYQPTTVLAPMVPLVMRFVQRRIWRRFIRQFGDSE